ncbi:F-box/LRR-repeat protein 16 [Cloeon dipterum]|uniref:F-box/LRR-repeat protein 16 n=1 Tax=Cloeon dipterum TaxID=197152 RepID=UPI00321FC4A7
MSMSAQGVVERASAELSKRINGLGLRSSSASAGSGGPTGGPPPGTHSPSKGTSVMERVTNVFCGGSSSSAANGFNGGHRGPGGCLPPPPDKPSRFLALRSTSAVGKAHAALRAPRPPPRTVPPPQVKAAPRVWHSWSDLMMDERFLARFFHIYFAPSDRKTLPQVCSVWRDVLYSSPRFWTGLAMVARCRELRGATVESRRRFYNSVHVRGMDTVVLSGAASDDDALELVRQLSAPAARRIHSLSLRCCAVTDRGLESLLAHMQGLFQLSLSGCNEVTEAGLWACLSPRIVSLGIADCINIADEAVGAVAQLLPSLYEFSLQAYHVTDAALGYFSPKQSATLSILRLHSCWELTNHGVVNIVHSLPNLTVLSLSGCSKITDDGVELVAENLPKLRSLDISWCPRITDAALEYIACDLTQLEELTLDRCVHITDIGVGYISTMLSLNALYLRWCSQVRDFGLQHLCGMRNLQTLSLAGCPLLTSSGLSSLIQLRHLRELELTNCPGASQELFDYLREHLPRCLVIE